MPRSKNSAVEWFASKAQLSRDEMIALIKQSRDYRHRIRGLERAALNGRRSMPQDEIEDLLTTRRYIVFNAILELYKRRTQKRFPFVPRYKRFRAIAPTLEFLREEIRSFSTDPTCVPIRQFPVAKPSGGERLISDFCTVDRSRQMILRDIVLASTPESYFDYAAFGAGRDKAVREIFNHIQQGYEHWAELDIRNAFPSIKPAHVRNVIPLRGAFMTIACVPVLETSLSNNPVDLQLPQGGLASQSILSAIVGREVHALRSESEAVFVYSDNMWIGARTRQAAERCLERLIERFRTLAGGPLELWNEEPVSLRRGQRLRGLGYQFRFFSDTQRFHCAIGNNSFDRFAARMRERLDAVPTQYLAEEYEKYFRAWLSGFQARTLNEISETLYRTSCDHFYFSYVEERWADEMDAA